MKITIHFLLRTHFENKFVKDSFLKMKLNAVKKYEDYNPLPTKDSF